MFKVKTSNNFLFIISLLITSVFINACNNKAQSIEELQTEVIAIHDEVMPKMDEIMRLQRKIKILQSDTTQVLPSDQKILGRNLIGNLENASDAMMNWMRNYDSLMKDMTDEEKIDYLEKQKIAIQQVKQEMLSSISEAKTFIEQNN